MTTSSVADANADHLAIAKRSVEEERAKHLAKVADLDAILVRLNNVQSPDGQPSSEIRIMPAVKAGEFKGMSRTRALETYMRQRKGHKIPLNRIVADLLLGGVEPGEKRKLNGSGSDAGTLAQNIKIALGQPSSRLYSREPEGKLLNKDARDIMVWLSPSADEPPPKRKR